MNVGATASNKQQDNQQTEPQQRLHGDSVPSTIEGKQGNPDEDLPSFLTYDNPDTADPSI